MTSSRAELARTSANSFAPTWTSAARIASALLLASLLAPNESYAASIQIPCLSRGTSSETPGLLSRCEDVVQELLEGADGKGGLRAVAKGHISRLYAGKVAQHSQASDSNGNGSIEASEIPMKSMPVPVCAPIVGGLVFELGKEKGQARFDELTTNHLNQSCGEYMEIEVKGSLTDVQVTPVRDRNNPLTAAGGRTRGQRESAFIQSLRVLAVEEAYATLAEEIRTGRKFSMQAGTDPLAVLVGEQQKNLSTAAKELGEDALAQKEILRCEKSRNVLKEDATYEVNSVQQKAQQLCAAWKLSQAAVFQLAAAELFERAGMYYRRAMEDGSGGVIERAITEIGDACESRARSAAKDKPLKWKKEASRAATQCYQEKAGPFLQRELRQLFPHVKAGIPFLTLLLSLLTLPFGGGRRRKEQGLTLGELGMIAGFTLAASACAGSCNTCDNYDGSGYDIYPSQLQVIAQCYWDESGEKLSESVNDPPNGYEWASPYYVCDLDTIENNDNDPYLYRWDPNEPLTVYCTYDEAKSACAAFAGTCKDDQCRYNGSDPQSAKMPDGVIAGVVSLYDGQKEEVNLAFCGSKDCDNAEVVNPAASYETCADSARLILGADATAAEVAKCCTAQGESDSQDEETSEDEVRWCTFKLSEETCTPSDTDPEATDEETELRYKKAFENLAGANSALESAGLLDSTADESASEDVTDNLSNTEGEKSAATASTVAKRRTDSGTASVSGSPAAGAFVPSSASGGGASGGSAGLGDLFGSSNSGDGAAELSAASGASRAASENSDTARLTGGRSGGGQGGSGYGGSGGSLSADAKGLDFGNTNKEAGGDAPVMGSEDPDDYFSRTDLDEDIFRKIGRKIDEKERQWEFDRSR